MALNSRQKLFVAEYVKSRNASKAARAAGYSKKTAGSQAHDLLKKPEIAKAIAKTLKRVSEKAELTAADVLAEIRKLAFVDLTRGFDEDGKFKGFSKIPRDLRAALVSVEVDELFAGRGASRIKVGHTRRLKIADKVRALEMLAKHFKLLTDVQEISGKDGGPVAFIALPSNGSEAPGTVSPAEPDLKKDENG